MGPTIRQLRPPAGHRVPICLSPGRRRVWEEAEVRSRPSFLSCANSSRFTFSSPSSSASEF
ncbi:hypothetical protein BHE74_00047084 [Ensete ventricosum]|uniref:Uncharacterized protein n=1 Tax=Ensete ventricosum TaxID=4639 RepID=A0A426Z4K9_ENSVE|nr:hypothetical protein B296_00034092 [Ensete ventricosum]RWW46959.1 hypothetical protein BHE74_00047084 [Ensete ventricosum]